MYTFLSLFFVLLSTLSLICPSTQAATTKGLSAATVESITKTFGIKPETFPDEGTVVISIPWDGPIQIKSVTINPFLGAISSIAFKKSDTSANQLVAFGDLTLSDDQISSVMNAALANGVSVTALHNHFLYEQPKLYFMHIYIEGPSQEVLAAIKNLINALKNSATKNAATNANPQTSSMSSNLLQDILGAPIKIQNGMQKYMVGRPFKTSCCSLGKGMGVGSWIAFQGDNTNSIAIGDLALTDEEVQPVLKLLNDQKILILAIHNHLLGETPRMISVHFATSGDPRKIANIFLQALRLTKTDLSQIKRIVRKSE